MNHIEVESLVKKFNKNFTAVDNISFSVKEGECFGLLGPNGAGKTTTLNILSTLLLPTSGKAIIAGFDAIKDKSMVRKNIGMVFQEPALDTKLTGRENLEFHAMMYGVDPKTRKERIDYFLNLVELYEKGETLVRNYSGGMKRRLEIARGLIQRPKVLFLDEPTLGLDSQTRKLIWDYIKKLKKETDISIILTTHYMEEADSLCDRIAIIDRGKIIALDTPEKLKEGLGGDLITVEVDKNPSDFLKNLSSFEWIKNIKSSNDSSNIITLTVHKANLRIAKVFDSARELGININSLDIHSPSLDDVFIKYTGSTIRNIEQREKEW